MRLGDLTPAAMIVLVAIIAISIGAQVLGKIQDTQTSLTHEWNVTDAGLEALGDFADWFAIIVVVVIAAIVIGLVMFFGRSTRGE